MMMWTRNTAQNLKPRGDVVNIADGSCAETEAGHGNGTSSRRADGNPEPDQAQTARGTTMMTDTPIIHINENSPEQIAYKLFLHIVAREDVELAPGRGKWPVDRRWILSTYAQCLKAVKLGVVD
jgi:hypothetical protein